MNRVPLFLVALLVIGWTLALNMSAPDANAAPRTYNVGTVAGHAHCRTTMPTTGTAVVRCSANWSKRLRPCPTDDSSNCYWNARVRGNGLGTSYIDVRGVTYSVKSAR